MTSSKYGWRWSSLLLAGALSVSSCADGAPDPSDDDSVTPVELGSHAQRLLAQRSVDVETWAKPGQSDSVSSGRVGLYADHGVVRALRDACDDAEVYQAKGRAGCGTSTDILVRSLCMGHWAQTIAETMHPIHLGKLGPSLDFVVTGDSRPQGPAYAALAADVPLSIAYSVQPPKAEDRTTWSLFATAMYARAVEEGQKFLPFACAADDDTKTYLAAQLADAATSLSESMDVTLQRLAASTALRRSAATSPSEAAQNEWRGAIDSRLESASLLTYVPPEYWERVPLFLARSASEGDLLIAGNAATVPVGFSKTTDTPIGYVLRTPSAATEQLRTCREERTVGSGANAVSRTVWMSAAATEAAAAGICNRADANWRVEGYLLSRSAAGTRPVYRSTRPDGFTSELRFDQTAGAQLLGYMFTEPDAGRWPIYSAEQIDAQGELAEDLLLSTRINPRQPADALAADLLRAFNADYHGAYSNVASPAALLDLLGLEPFHLADAAKRLLAKADLFGVPVIRDLGYSGTPARYTLPEPHQLRAPHPAYLYALTQGGGLPYANIDNQKLESDPLQLTIPEVLARFVARFKSTMPSAPAAPASAAAFEVLAQAASHVSQTVMGSVEVRAREASSGGIDRVTFSLRDVGPGPFEVWVGRAGLACATHGRVGRQSCVPSDYLASALVDAKNGSVLVQAAGLPPQAYGQSSSQKLTVFPDHEPIFVVRRAPGRPAQVLFGVYPKARGTPGATYRLAEGPALSPWLEDALSSALAADPEDPSQAFMSCSGLPTNSIPSRVKLEDELAATANREDAIDDSFEYYLNEARASAQRADVLGEQLFEQGLQMDMRAEAAVEELEELCGGTVNVGLLSDEACEVGKCDLSELLDRQVGSLPEQLRSELAGVHDCLGVDPDTAPEWVAVGDKELCAWRYTGDGDTGKFGACTPCPDKHADGSPTHCPDRCPLNPADGDCKTRLAGFDDVEAVKIDQTLNFSVTRTELPTPAERQPAWLFARYLTLDRGLLPSDQQAAFAELQSTLFATIPRTASTDVATIPSTESIRRDWATQDHIYRMAQSIGFEEDFEGRLRLTINGNPWVDVDRLLSQWRADDPKSDVWPCKPMTPELAAVCTDAVVAELQRGGYTRPLVCGMCDSKAREDHEIKERLKATVLALKRLSGAGSSNVRTLSIGETIDIATLRSVAGGSLRQLGSDSTGNTYTVYREDKGELQRCYDREAIGGVPAQDGSTQFICFSLEAGSLSPAYDAGFLWAKSNCLKGEIVAPLGEERGEVLIEQSETGCGAIPDFLDGRIDDVGASFLTTRWVNQVGGYCVTRPWSYFGTRGRVATCYESEEAALAEARADRTVVLSLGGRESTSETLSGPAIIDALTLAYAAERSGAGACATLWKELPALQSARDFNTVKQMLMCSAEEAERRLGQMFLPHVPQDIIDDLRTRQATGTFPRHRGEYGAALARLLAIAQNMSRQQDMVVQGIRNLANEFDIGTARLDALDLSLQVADVDTYIAQLQAENAVSGVRVAQLQQRIANLRSRQALANQATSCTLAVLSALPSVSCGFPSGCSVSVNTGDILAAGATCMNAEQQMSLESWVGDAQDEVGDLAVDEARNDVRIQEAVLDKLKLGKEVTETDKRIALLEMQRLAGEKADAINEAVTSLNETYAQLHATITDIERIRARARRAASKAMLLDNDNIGRQYSVNTAMRARMNTLRMRYEQARESAIRAAYVARRALEQKIGVNLSSMRNSVAGLRAPSEWIDEVCSLSALDASELRQGAGEGGARQELEARHGQGTVSDYVERLADLKDAYRNAYPFQDGEDVMVVSVRDELLNVREPCEVEGANLLLATTDLGQAPWQAQCSTSHCPQITPSDEQPFACGGRSDELSEGTVGRCRAMGGASAVWFQVSARAPIDDQALSVDEPQYFQFVDLPSGEYWLSWYENTPCNEASKLVAHAQLGQSVSRLSPARVNCVDSSLSPHSGYLSDPWTRAGWSRRFLTIDTGSTPLAGIGFGSSALPAVGMSSAMVGLGAPQLERVTKLVSSLPNDFFPTQDSRFAPVGECEDTDGDQFRSSRHWDYACEYYCPAGASDDCEQWADRSQLARRCFYETSFRLSQSDIELGKLITQGGFSAGNFNYRHNEIGVNVVGTAVRNCEGSALPSTCYANNFLQYTLHHDGPFRVRNYDGENYYAPLYPGRIQQSKALTAERYVTNPISSADAQLITPYMRSELRGRPLEGSYTLRVYESSELDWSRVEDVQLLINYRYWTRLE